MNKKQIAKEAEDIAKVTEFLNQAFQEGVSAAILMFLKKYKLTTEKGSLGLDTHWVFAQHLNSEYPQDTDEGRAHQLAFPYPFKESLRAELDPRMQCEIVTLIKLLQHEEKETVRKLCRIISAGVVLNFLQRNEKEVINFYEGLKAKK